MKLIIAGYGYVGKAYHAILKESWDIEIHDPSLGYVADFDKTCQGSFVVYQLPLHQMEHAMALMSLTLLIKQKN